MQSKEIQWLTVKDFLIKHRGIVGRSAVYERLHDGSLPSIRLGRKILIPADALERVLAQLKDASSKRVNKTFREQADTGTDQ